jgi:hypothetical protein
VWAEIEQWALKKLNRLATRRNFYTYDDITLKLYLEIARTGKVSLLAKRKLIIPLETIYSLWEEIVRRNAEANEDINSTRTLSKVTACYSANTPL